jgi:hypothetical protein
MKSVAGGLETWLADIVRQCAHCLWAGVASEWPQSAVQALSIGYYRNSSSFKRK